MKIVVASDSFKGSCSTLEIANAIESGIRRVFADAEIIKLPIADGGEGTVDALVFVKNGIYEEVEVMGPLGVPVIAKYGIIPGNIGVIEMSASSGLTLLDKGDLNPSLTTTYGTGQLIKDAMEKGIRKIYIGLGGSATNDGGVGMAQALGASFKDYLNNEIGFGGGELNKIKTIDITNINPLVKETEIIAISDVTNILCGPYGASYIFGKQKGANEKMMKSLDGNLKYLGKIVKEQLGKDIINIPGSGAAGGLGGGLIAFCDTAIEPGIEKILDILGMDNYLIGADLVITGEGRIDGQSRFGKAPVGIAKRAKKYNIPVVAIVGSIGDGASELYSCGIDLIMDIIDRPMTLEEAIESAPKLIQETAERVARICKLNINWRL